MRFDTLSLLQKVLRNVFNPVVLALFSYVPFAAAAIVPSLLGLANVATVFFTDHNQTLGDVVWRPLPLP